ncbi:MAG: orotidine-5'-phosphate decarboxylase [Lentisphaeria bacterium]
MRQVETELIVALDVASLDEAAALLDNLGDSVTWFKIGKQIFTENGPAAVKLLKDRDKKVFLDLKFHDIPNTVAGAVRSAGHIGADMVNVHAAGGIEMMSAAVEAAREFDMFLVGVTVLTSMNAAELANTGVADEPEVQVLRLARLAREAGLDGVVCSAWEINAIQKACGPDFQLVVPGIRPAGAEHGDQKRVMTPAQAAAAGTQFIVVGRPVRRAADPRQAAAMIKNQLQSGREATK